MMRPRGLVLWLVGVCLVISPQPAAAQPDGDGSSPHRLLEPLEGQTGDPQSRLTEKLTRAKRFRELVQDILKDPSKYNLKEELEQFKRRVLEQGGAPQLDTNDPNVQSMVRKLLDQYRQNGGADAPPGLDPQQFMPLPSPRRSPSPP